MDTAKRDMERTISSPDPLGQRLRDRRKFLKLTLQEVADRAGLSVGFISQIERGIASPSLSSLASVARVLGTDVREFLIQPSGSNSSTRRTERPVYAIHENSLTYERLSASFPGNVLRSVIIHEPPGHRSEPIEHEGEEIFFILEGAMTVEIEGQRTVLGTGDSIHFASTRKHQTWNHTSTPTTILHTCTMDIFGDEPREGDAFAGHAVTRSSRRRKTGSETAETGTPAATPSDNPDFPLSEERQ